MKKIAIYSETKNKVLDETSYELITKAFELKNFAKNIADDEIKITNIVISNSIDEESVEKSYLAGADEFVLIKNDDFAMFNQITYANAFLSYFYSNFHDFILFPATLSGRMIAPRITTMLNTGLVADCTGVDFILKDNNLKLASTRPTFGAELMATILSKSTPECATIRPKTFIAKFNNQKKGVYVEYPCSVSNDHKIFLIDTLVNEIKKQVLGNSNVVLCAGFGLYDGKNNEYIEKLQDLAKRLNADFAITRKLVDYGVLNNSYQIGQTGTTVTPKTYIGFGVSGAIQHIQGMKNAKTIVAINTDENAEIFKYSDYKIIADAKNIIDDMLEKVILQ